MTALPVESAAGKLMQAIKAKAYAHHMVPTHFVTFTANHELKRATRLGLD